MLNRTMKSRLVCNDMRVSNVIKTFVEKNKSVVADTRFYLFFVLFFSIDPHAIKMIGKLVLKTFFSQLQKLFLMPFLWLLTRTVLYLFLFMDVTRVQCFNAEFVVMCMTLLPIEGSKTMHTVLRKNLEIKFPAVVITLRCSFAFLFICLSMFTHLKINVTLGNSQHLIWP